MPPPSSPPQSSYEPRRRKDRTSPDAKLRSGGQHDASSPRAATEAKPQRPSFPLAAFLWPARGGTSQWIILPLVLMIVGLYRWAAGFWPYSGFNAPPMHGDFEAQRHWMELTVHLPITQWYFYDLEWWGLDYPPLTAYHSWILGKLGSFLNPRWFALDTSRGLDDPLLKVFMRASVLISEYLVYVPAVVLFVRFFARQQRVGGWDASVALVAILMQPATILIDHAHFQYNTVMLGFVAAAVTCALLSRFFWASAFFVSALCYKQMALYYSPVIFAYFLGSCVFPRLDLVRFAGIAVVTLASFGVICLPLVVAALFGARDGSLPAPPLLSHFHLDSKSMLYQPVLQMAQAIHRIFPFARGLFEDKVANFWCAVHTFYKLRSFPTELLQRASLLATLAAVLPPSVVAFLQPRPTVLLPALAASAWAFFLFSFQVHEKSVLLPLFPMTLLLVAEEGLDSQIRAWVTWANMLGAWTMYPLLKRDGLSIPYFALTIFWGWLMGIQNLPFTVASNGSMAGLLSGLIHVSFYLAMTIWHFAEAYVIPPQSKPDLWVVVNVLIGAAGFGICYLWCLWKMVDGIRGVRALASGKKSR